MCSAEVHGGGAGFSTTNHIRATEYDNIRVFFPLAMSQPFLSSAEQKRQVVVFLRRENVNSFAIVSSLWYWSKIHTNIPSNDL